MSNYSTVTNRSAVDSAGSTNDKIFGQAVLLSRPDPIMKQYNLARMYEVGGQATSIDVPVFSNFDLSWTSLTGTGSDTGSDLTVTTTPAATYKTITPIMYSAAISVHESVDLVTNEMNFMTLADQAGAAVTNEIDRIGIVEGLLSSDVTQIYSAGGFASSGSISSGSTLTPDDLEDAKNLLMAGSVNTYKADTAVMHPTQYTQFKQHDDFQNQVYSVINKAKFQNGEVVEYAGMKILHTPLIPSYAGSPTNQNIIGTTGRPVIVFDSRVSFAMAQKTAGFKVRSMTDIMKHVNVKVFDIFVAAKCLVPAAVVKLWASN